MNPSLRLAFGSWPVAWTTAAIAVGNADPALPVYHPEGKAGGTLSSVGDGAMKGLMDAWLAAFRARQPAVKPGRWQHASDAAAVGALMFETADIAPLAREAQPAETAPYAHQFAGDMMKTPLMARVATLDGRPAYIALNKRPGSPLPVKTREFLAFALSRDGQELVARDAPLEIRVARGGFNTPQRTTAQAIFVHASNPLARISVPQIAAILGDHPSITRWGQLGLAGEWADRSIAIYIPPRVAPNATSMQILALKGGGWNAAVHEGTIAETAAAIARDPNAIGFGGFEEGGPGLKSLAVARDDAGPYYEGTAPNASTGRYPLTRYMYIRLNRAPGAPLPPDIKEFLRYILSREGQEPILYSGYFPLTAAEVREELAKLE